jgi:D-beta-D-heptose 7-phosphate kinase/D-beta-D-heptose 1-phosphate adenosyltransferase
MRKINNKVPIGAHEDIIIEQMCKQLQETIDRGIIKELKEMALAREGKIAIVSGGFDPIHVGHLRMFEASAKLGSLYVILNSDDWLTRKKGKYFMTYEHRKEIIEGFACVEEVIPVDDADNTVLKGLQWLFDEFSDEYHLIFCNGGDRVADNVPEHILCEKLGIECVWNVGGGKVESSSDLVKRYGDR